MLNEKMQKKKNQLCTVPPNCTTQQKNTHRTNTVSLERGGERGVQKVPSWDIGRERNKKTRAETKR